MALVAVDPASGALVKGGRKVFPLCLSNGPPPRPQRAERPQRARRGRRGGINMIRTGTAAWGAETAPGLIALERQKLDAARRRTGSFGWLWLGDLTDLPPRQTPSQPSDRERLLETVVNGLKAHPALAVWKGVDEPRNPARGRRVDPPGRARPRLRAPEAARSAPSARRDPGPGQHRRPADALPARVRPDRHGHLPGVVSARASTAARRTRASRSSATGLA